MLTIKQLSIDERVKDGRRPRNFHPHPSKFRGWWWRSSSEGRSEWGWSSQQNQPTTMSAPSSPATYSSAPSSATSSPASSPLPLGESFVTDAVTFALTTPPKKSKCCAVCGVVGHTTPTCPKRSCTKCGPGHSDKQCPFAEPAPKKQKKTAPTEPTVSAFLSGLQTLAIARFEAACEAECARKIAAFKATVSSMGLEEQLRHAGMTTPAAAPSSL